MSGRAESSECRSRRPTRRPAAIGSTRVHPPCRAGSRKLAFLCISASAGARPAFLCKQDGCCACEDGARGLLPLALGSTCALDLVTRRRSIRSGCAGAKKLLLDSLVWLHVQAAPRYSTELVPGLDSQGRAVLRRGEFPAPDAMRASCLRHPIASVLPSGLSAACLRRVRSFIGRRRPDLESEPRASWRSGKQRPNSARCVRSCRWDARSRLMCVEGAALPVRGHKHLLAAGLRGSSVHVSLAARRRWSKTG